MKVLMQSRKNFFELRGGDTVQLEKTKMELEKLGVEVDFSLDFEPDLSNYDLVHLSNVTRIQETYLHVKNAKKQGKPIVLSTIFWPMDEFERLGQVGIRNVPAYPGRTDDIADDDVAGIVRIHFLPIVTTLGHQIGRAHV